MILGARNGFGMEKGICVCVYDLIPNAHAFANYFRFIYIYVGIY